MTQVNRCGKPAIGFIGSECSNHGTIPHKHWLQQTLWLEIHIPLMVLYCLRSLINISALITVSSDHAPIPCQCYQTNNLQVRCAELISANFLVRKKEAIVVNSNYPRAVLCRRHSYILTSQLAGVWIVSHDIVLQGAATLHGGNDIPDQICWWLLWWLSHCRSVAGWYILSKADLVAAWVSTGNTEECLAGRKIPPIAWSTCAHWWDPYPDWSHPPHGMGTPSHSAAVFRCLSVIYSIVWMSTDGSRNSPL